MDDNFPDNEKLYRAVWPASMFWKRDGRVSSAAFKDKKGLSVERGDFRPDYQVVDDMKKIFSGVIISVSAGQCREVRAVLKYLPSQRSRYHSEIHGGNDSVRLSNSQAKYLADLAVLEG